MSNTSHFITAQMEDRVKTICETENLDPIKAREKIEDIDKRRANYYGELNGKVWGQADNYDICLNTSATGLDGAVFMVKNAVEGKVIQMRLTEDEA